MRLTAGTKGFLRTPEPVLNRFWALRTFFEMTATLRMGGLRLCPRHIRDRLGPGDRDRLGPGARHPPPSGNGAPINLRNKTRPADTPRWQARARPASSPARQGVAMKKYQKSNVNNRRPGPTVGGRSQRWVSGAGSEPTSSPNAQRNYERYLALARAEAQNGNTVAAENYYQHAEHYFRSMSSDRAK